ncbi:hypothetical protein J4E05_21670 [Thalassospira sp. NFXS8]|uniref:WD40 repeat domain-containing protein n=1 Tax=Thalassospira sp. NFXS8 TaxID=2819093 RepID=UPI0032DFAC4C
MTRTGISTLTAVATVMMLSGCASPGSSIPQAGKTYTGPLSADAEAKLRAKGFGMSDAERDKLENIDRTRLAAQFDFQKLGQPVESPFAGFGFVGAENMPYAVYRNGKAVTFTPEGTDTELEQVAPRLSGVVLAGEEHERIVGESPRGTMMSWNTKDLSQQVVLRPQNSTFGLTNVFDVGTIENSPYLAMAVEGGRVELWDLAAGEMVEFTENKVSQPRQIMDGSAYDDVIYGTNRGEIEEWKPAVDSTKLYAHAGPVLDIVSVGGRDLIVSSAKDGTVTIYDRKKGEIVHTLEFDTVVYNLVVAPNNRYAAIFQTFGSPYYIDFDAMESRRLYVGSGAHMTQGRFAKDGTLLLARENNDMIRVWSMERNSLVARISPEQGGNIVGFDVSDALSLIAVATTEGNVEYWNLDTGRYIRTAFHTDTPLIGVEISPDGTRAVVAQADGQLARWRVMADKPEKTFMFE